MKGENAGLFSIGESKIKKAVAYYRHSAEDKQENSVPLQKEHAQKFAAENQIEIIHEEADEGKSGLLANRPAFNQLFANWIYNDQAPHFDYVLVYDVSRWGRFQDQDEAAFYEFLCKRRGKRVIYVDHGFPQQENQLVEHLRTSIERYMAAEYSRQLSNKVWHGCMNISRQGFSAGGTACFGMVRLLLDEQRKPVRILKRGEHKQIANERVTFVPSNDKTSHIVQEIFRLFIEKRKNARVIAEELNRQGLKSCFGKEWDRQKILRILTNESYTGTRIYNKTGNRLKRGKQNNPPAQWVRCPNAFPALVEPEQFWWVQEEIYWVEDKWKSGHRALRRAYKITRDSLRLLLMNHGWKSDDEIHQIISRLPLMYSIGTQRPSRERQWCFVLSPQAGGFENVIGMGVNHEYPKLVDCVFAIPRRDFGALGIHFFSDRDLRYQKYLVSSDRINELFLNLAREVKGKFYLHESEESQ